MHSASYLMTESDLFFDLCHFVAGWVAGAAARVANNGAAELPPGVLTILPLGAHSGGL